jgi:hypothetical protein
VGTGWLVPRGERGIVGCVVVALGCTLVRAVLAGHVGGVVRLLDTPTIHPAPPTRTQARTVTSREIIPLVRPEDDLTAVRPHHQHTGRSDRRHPRGRRDLHERWLLADRQLTGNELEHQAGRVDETGVLQRPQRRTENLGPQPPAVDHDVIHVAAATDDEIPLHRPDLAERPVVDLGLGEEQRTPPQRT